MKLEYVQKHSQVTDKSPMETATKKDGFKAKLGTAQARSKTRQDGIPE
jgi:hypothetical protein